jgi:hypothetical protein
VTTAGATLSAIDQSVVCHASVSLACVGSIDESVLFSERYSKAICHPPFPFSNAHSDIHLWDRERDLPEFEKNFVIGSDADPAIRAHIISIIESYWDCFYSAGVMKPILHFEFAIDTGGSLRHAAGSLDMVLMRARSS